MLMLKSTLDFRLQLQYISKIISLSAMMLRPRDSALHLLPSSLTKSSMRPNSRLLRVKQCFTSLTKSSTRQNSGVLRVLSGSAGAFTRISSVSGGKFLMKQYLYVTTHTYQYISSWRQNTFISAHASRTLVFMTTDFYLSLNHNTNFALRLQETNIYWHNILNAKIVQLELRDTYANNDFKNLTEGKSRSCQKG